MENFREYIREKCLTFGVHVVELYKVLKDNKNEYVMSKQLLRAGTSIGANLVEAQHAVSKDDFRAKIYISLKECAESLYWIELLHRTNYLDETEFKSINVECLELYRVLTSTTKALENNKTDI
ncbi:MAG: four helix bundle protein [Bacteroidaceae bacterium]|nr:four helix bundle protein [Bacteroidaceae bacterium]